MANMQRGSTTSLEAAVGEASLVTPKAGKTISQELESRREAISQALGEAIDAQYFIRTVVIETQKNPELLKCSLSSLMGSVMMAAQLRLEFGPMGLAYVLPRWSGKNECFEAQFQVGYKGWISLARRSNEIRDLVALPVYEKDEFRRWRDETGEHLLHVPHLGEDRGEILRYYGHCILKDGGSIVQVMELSDIARHKAFSQSATSKFSPWVTNPMPMNLKTCIIAMRQWIPMQVKDAQLVAADEQIVIERHGGELDIQRIDAQPQPEGLPEISAHAETGEILGASTVEETVIPTEVQAPLKTTRTTPPQGDPDGKHLSAALAELDDALRAEAEEYLKDTFGSDLSAYPAKGVLETLDEWLNSPADPGAVSTQQRASEPQGPQGDTEPPWDPENRTGGHTAASPSVPDDLLTDTKKKIDTWTPEICDRVLGEWGQAKTGNLAAKRTKLLVLLAPERVANNPAAVNLF